MPSKLPQFTVYSILFMVGKYWLIDIFQQQGSKIFLKKKISKEINMTFLLSFVPMMLTYILIGVILFFGVFYIRRIAMILEYIAEKLDNQLK